MICIELPEAVGDAVIPYGTEKIGRAVYLSLRMLEEACGLKIRRVRPCKGVGCSGRNCPSKVGGR